VKSDGQGGGQENGTEQQKGRAWHDVPRPVDRDGLLILAIETLITSIVAPSLSLCHLSLFILCLITAHSGRISGPDTALVTSKMSNKMWEVRLMLRRGCHCANDMPAG
jgi:hypothetical protein